MKPKALILLTTAALATALSGCSTGEPGQATAKSDLDLTKFVDDPCRLFTSDELNSQDEFKAPELNDTSQGPSCVWDPKDSKRPAYVVTMSTRKTFEALKEKARKGKTFRETTVAGHPAFISDSANGKGTCDATVSTSGGDAVEVRITSHFTGNPEYPIACDISEKLAGRVVEKLKG